MGADIHCYIERTSWKPELGKKRMWFGFGGRINPGRDYRMFGLLAGVRTDKQPLVPLRGLPDDMSWEASDDAFLRIGDTPESAERDNYCSREQAERWVTQGSSLWVDDKKDRITHPDWHSHTWLTPDEWGAAVAEAARFLHSKPDPGYYAIEAVLKAYAERGEDARVVFWFDN